MYLAEFAYNNSYQAMIKMAPYEALYGRCHRSPLAWHKAGEKKVLEWDLQKKTHLIEDTTEAIKDIRQCIAITQSR